jgi:hypothetical protein
LILIKNVNKNNSVNIISILFLFTNLFAGIMKNKNIKKKYVCFDKASSIINKNNIPISFILIFFILLLNAKFRKVAITRNESAIVKLSAEREDPARIVMGISDNINKTHLCTGVILIAK